ncbi:hypothetical protein [Kitasatospora sp. NPDC008115]|uniref:hypothetical protein n=1 Tax=Kitasatospora sp. NPDC008115 TaxID=3364022 RepID=UPI0036E439F0
MSATATGPRIIARQRHVSGADDARPSLLGRLLPGAVEAAAGVLVALGFTWICTFIRVNPMQRVGQVSGLAALQLRFILVFIAIALLWWAASRWFSRPIALRTAAASLSGLATGLYAGGVAVALRGTVWPLNGRRGDSGQLQLWVGDILAGRPISSVYPPLFPHLLARWTDLLYPDRPGLGLKMLGLVLIALTGPVVYLAWRLLLPPLWALAIGVVPVFPIVHAAKPYVDVALLVLIPVLARLVTSVLRSTGKSVRTALLTGAAYGLALALLFLWYSGWFVWSAPGALAVTVLTLVKIAKRGKAAVLRAAALLGATGAVFLLVAGTYLQRLLAGSDTPDTYMYFDTNVDPAYFAMWQGDSPGVIANGAWPLPGELGGVGVFVLLLIVGVGVALWLGPALPVVQVAAFCMLGAFLMRYWFASHMERDQLVQLYPRTSAELLYCGIVLCGMACYLLSRKFAAREETGEGERAESFARTVRVPALRTGGAVLCALAFFFSMAGSSTVDRFMPANQGSWGSFAWFAHITTQPDGKCPVFAPEGKCG